jgi:ribosomal protein S18 acetylase RimI-like enzyme
MKLELKRLEENDGNINSIQSILENAPEYFTKVSGELAERTAGKEVFIALPEKFDRELKHVLGIFADDRMIGVIDCLIGFPHSHKAHLGLLLLDQAHQRKRFGTLIYQQLENYLSLFPQVTIVRLAVVETNQAVLKFWMECGFRATGEKKPYSHKNVSSHSILMEKNLY